MVKCLECGNELPVLQWTHFKYKCSGKFNNAKEYLSHYPGAQIVDKEVSKSFSNTLENFVKKYGEEEGNTRWKTYCQKQSKTNSLEYKKEKYGWDEDQFNEYNKSRAVTLRNMVLKYGEESGLKKWQEYCDRQAFTNSLEYFIEKTGSYNEGLTEYNRVNSEKARAHDPFWIMKTHNISFDQALEVLSSRRAGNNFVSEGEKYFVDEFEKILEEPIQYCYKTHQFCKWSDIAKQPVFYDIVDSNRKKAIEYNGDYWHANPKKYKADEMIKKVNLFSREIWEKDQNKRKILLDLDFEVRVIWESDFIENPSLLLELKEWWYGSSQSESCQSRKIR